MKRFYFTITENGKVTTTYQIAENKQEAERLLYKKYPNAQIRFISFQ